MEGGELPGGGAVSPPLALRWAPSFLLLQDDGGALASVSVRAVAAVIAALRRSTVDRSTGGVGTATIGKRLRLPGHEGC